MTDDHFYINGQHMKLSQFKYKLPEDRIALYPAACRDESRLLVLHKKTGEIEHRIFKEVINYFDEKDVFVFNNTKVFPARLYGNKEKTGAEIEIFLLRELNKDLRLWDVLVDPARKIRIGNKLYFGDDDALVAEVIDNTTSRGRTLRFLFDGDYDEFKKALYEQGETPLPRWVREKVEEIDAERYQTIFAKHEGAVAAPTAGLHFSKQLMKRLEIKGVKFPEITLHVGAGTFKPVKSEEIGDHDMHTEHIAVRRETLERLIRHEGLAIAVGTTSVRTLESLYYMGILAMRGEEDLHVRQWMPYEEDTTGTSTCEALEALLRYMDERGMDVLHSSTQIIIAPGYDFHIVKMMITNFHQPQSTLLLLVSAFVKGNWKSIYDYALENDFRFLSYGDSSILIP